MMFPFLFEIFFILVLSRLSVCVYVCVHIYIILERLELNR